MPTCPNCSSERIVKNGFQGRSVMDFFTQALMASAGFIDRPSLIP